MNKNKLENIVVVVAEEVVEGPIESVVAVLAVVDANHHHWLL